MVVDMKHRAVDGHLLKWMIAAGVSWLEHHKQQVNNMNVFPVPDGDTGTNMLLTIRKAYQQIASLDDTNVGFVIENAARGALTGARGNSGTILSMLLRGFAQSLKGKEVMDAHAFALACQSAVEYAYETVRSVMEPVEGTILTVAREAAESIRERAHTEQDLRVLLNEMIVAARLSLDNTPNLLPRLKEAGVVDSGGMGLVYILEGMQRLIQGEPISIVAGSAEDTRHEEIATWQDALIPDDEEGYGYDVQFLMLGQNLDVHQIRRDISAMGWSPLVDGDEQLIKVHIHVHDPGEPLSYAIRMGVDLDDIVVENMQAQYLQYVQDRSQREVTLKQVDGVAVVTVARGDGLHKLFEEYGAVRVISGGQTMNPSTEDFLSAIESLTTDEIILLPNNGNVIMAAQQAANHPTGKNVRVVPSKTIQQGIAALLAYMNTHESGSFDEISESMQESLGAVVSAEVTTATRDARIDTVDVREGDTIGLINGKLVVAGTNLADVTRDLLQKARAADYEIVTFYYGEDITPIDASEIVEMLQDEYPRLEFEIVYGGQPLYPFLISIE
jgi:hypothetical protein